MLNDMQYRGYSSQTRSSCGTVDKRSRKSQAVFTCTSCGHTDNADRNAAVVILSRGNTPSIEVASYGADEVRTVQDDHTFWNPLNMFKVDVNITSVNLHSREATL